MVGTALQTYLRSKEQKKQTLFTLSWSTLVFVVVLLLFSVWDLYRFTQSDAFVRKATMYHRAVQGKIDSEQMAMLSNQGMRNMQMIIDTIASTTKEIEHTQCTHEDIQRQASSAVHALRLSGFSKNDITIRTFVEGVVRLLEDTFASCEKTLSMLEVLSGDRLVQGKLSKQLQGIFELLRQTKSTHEEMRRTAHRNMGNQNLVIEDLRSENIIPLYYSVMDKVYTVPLEWLLEAKILSWVEMVAGVVFGLTRAVGSVFAFIYWNVLTHSSSSSLKALGMTFIYNRRLPLEIIGLCFQFIIAPIPEVIKRGAHWVGGMDALKEIRWQVRMLLFVPASFLGVTAVALLLVQSAVRVNTLDYQSHDDNISFAYGLMKLTAHLSFVFLVATSAFMFRQKLQTQIQKWDDQLVAWVSNKCSYDIRKRVLPLLSNGVVHLLWVCITLLLLPYVEMHTGTRVHTFVADTLEFMGV